LRNTILGLLGLIILLAVLVNLTPVQNYLARKGADILADKLKTKVTLGHVRVDFLNHLLIEKLYIEDHNGDTLLYAGEARVRISDWFILRKDKPVLRYIGLHNAYAHLYRTARSADWNYQFVIDAFDTGVKDTTKSQNKFELDLEKVDLQHVRFNMDDAWVGSDMNFDVGSLRIDANDIDIKKKLIDINKLDLSGSTIKIRDYIGGRPKRTRPKLTIIDTTAFNPAHWAVKLNQLTIQTSAFFLKSTEKAPYPNEFDPSHIYVTNIEVDAHKITIVDDTIRGQVRNIAGNERSGLKLKKLAADVFVSPNATICKNLFLATNNSQLHDYYAMHYTRFPDFTEYVDKVIMEGHLNNSRVDPRDVAFFAPPLRRLPANIVRLTGHIAGTVDSLVGKKLYFTDGFSTLRGNLSMVGLPDINTTFINFQQGELFTTGDAIMKYAPAVRNNPNVAVEKLSYIYYRGNFTGYIENFAANGTLNTNLGTIQSDVKLRLPGMDPGKSSYSGTVVSNNFNAGILFRQSLLGTITFNAKVSGVAFDPINAAVNINTVISHLDLNGYTYSNITAEGVLAKKKFDGKLLVDDPNLALSFNGNIDFSEELLSINANAYLLKSDLQALNLTKDSVLASADFDLNYVGNSIDNFFGYAKLYNINLLRNHHRLDVDSIYLRSSTEEGQKVLTLESNDVAARIQGKYQLSSLPYSFQQYISGYLPNYISPPTRYAADQDLIFTVTTREVDSLLGVLLPNVKGFNNATVNGSLNTSQQQLTLNAKIPYGYINDIHLNNVTLEGKGNFALLSLKADIENIVVGKGILSASMSIKTSLGNDSLSFNIASTSPDAVGTASLNGHAYARGDSLYLRLLPSEFYLNKTRWEIPTGNYFTFSQDYLLIRNFFLRSGLQEISIATENEGTLQSLLVETKELDMAQLGNMAGLADYQPDGRINGTVRIDHLFGKLMLKSDLTASNVKLGTDTLGNIILAGSYDGSKKIVSLEPRSGVYRGSSSIRTAGSMSFDTTNRQKLNGYIEFNNASITWLTPLVTDFLSQMTGVVNGTINIGGSATEPDIDGSVTLTDAATKLDILGTYYKIPSATISVNNKAINFGSVTLYDVYNNVATLTGGITHDRFRNMRFNNVRLTSPEFEVLNLKDYDNNTFYGNLIANVDPLTVSGTFDDIRLSVTASPAKKSHIYIPVKSSNDIGSYSYVSFKSYGEQQTIKKRNKNKFSLTIIGKMNPLAEMTLVLDPATGDMINAKGYGNITLNVPANDDIKMFGNYDIEEGDYTFTFRQLFFRKNFIINSGSRISFNGLLSHTDLNINGIYSAKARLIDLLEEKEKVLLPDNELRDAKTQQDVNVLLHMSGSLQEPRLTFNIDLPEKRSEGTFAYIKIKSINLNDRELFDQVAAILLIGSFIPPEGLVGSTAASGAINNVSEILSTTASSQLTNIVNKLLGNQDLAVEFKYKNYNLSDPSTYTGINRNEISLGVRKNLFKDRLVVEIGSAYDWGRPTSSSSNSSNLNLANDFRVQYLLTEDGRIRLNVFRTSNYDVLLDDNVRRGGIGISYRKTFDNLYELFHSKNSKKRDTQDTSAIKGTF
jgi:hypothetical protein